MGERAALIRNYRPQMDGLRAVACLIVLVGHSLAIADPIIWYHLTGVPKIGVWLFFVLSAFLLTVRLLSEPMSLSSLAEYGVSRALRIIPLFVIAVFFYYVVGMHRIEDGEMLWQVLTFQRNAGHLWTIPPEFGFYVLLPMVVYTAGIGKRALGRLGPFLVILGIISTSVIVWPPTEPHTNAHFPLWYSVAFGAGILAACAAVDFGNRLNAAWLIPMSLAAILAVILIYKAGLGGDPSNDLMNKHYLFGPLWAVVTYSVYLGTGVWSRLLSARWLVLVGEASFSIYLFHWAFVVWTAPLPGYLSVPVAVFASILVGRAGYRWIELPIYQLREAIWRPSLKTSAARTAS